MAKPLSKLFICLLAGMLILTSCAQPGKATPPPATAAPLPTTIPEAIAVELGTVGKGTPIAGAWSPDGTRLAISSTQGIIIYTRPGWEVENFISLPARVGEDVDIEFLAGGKSLLFRGNGSKNILYEVNLLNNEITELPFRSISTYRTRLTVSPDGKTIASSRTQRSYTKDEKNPTNLEIIDKASGKVTRTFSSPIDSSSAINSAVFSPDSKLLAAGGDDNHVRLYDVATGEIRLDGSHDSDVRSVAFSPDGKILVSAGDDATIQFWDVETGKNLRTMKDFTTTISFAGYFSHGEDFIIQFQNGSFQKWDLDEKKLPQHKVDFDLPVEVSGYIHISSDGEALLSLQDEKVKVWDLKTGVEETTLPEFTGSFSDMEFSGDGKYLAAMDSSSTVDIWETGTGKFYSQLKIKNGYGSDISFQPVNNLLAVADSDGQIQVWDIFQNKIVSRYQSEDNCTFQSIQYSPDGSLLAATAYKCGMYIWDTSTGKLRVRLESEQEYSSKTSIWFDLKRDEVFATNAFSRSVSSWNLTTGNHLREVKLSPDVITPFIDPMHNRVYEPILSESSRILTAWDAVTGEKVVETAQQNCSFTQAIDPSGTLLATYQTDAIAFYHLGSLQPLTTVAFTDNPAKMVFSPNKQYMAVETSTNRGIYIFNTESVYERAKLLKDAPPPAMIPSPTTTPTIAPTLFPEDIEELIPVELPVTLPGAITKNRIKEVTSLGTFGFGYLYAAIWSPDSQYFILSSNSNILLYRADTAQPVQMIVTDRTPDNIIFSPNSKYLAINSLANLTLWDVQSGQSLHVWTEYQTDNPFNTVSFSPDSQNLLVRKLEVKDKRTIQRDIVLDIKTGDYVDTKPVPDDDSSRGGLTLSPDGSFAIEISNQAIHIIDPSTRVIRYTLERPDNISGTIQNWGISPQGKLMVRYPFQTGTTEQKTKVEMWDVSVNNPPSRLWSGEAGPIYADEGRPYGYPNYDFSPDGKMLAVSDMGAMVRIWDAASGKLLQQMESGSKISFSPDASLLLIVNQGSASIWGITADHKFSKKAEIEGFGSSSAYSSDFFSGDQFVTISNQKINTWDISGVKELKVPGRTQLLENTKPGMIAVSDNHLIATTQEHGKISIYDASTGSLIKNLAQGDEKSDVYFSTIAISHDGKTVVSTRYTNADGKSSINVWDVSSGNIKKEIPYPSFNISQLIFSSNDRLIFGISSPGNKLHGIDLAIWDVETGSLLRYYSNLGSAISLHPNGVILTSIQDDGALSFLDMNTGKVLWQGQSAEYIRDLAFSPDGKLLAILSSKAIEFWDATAYEKLSEFPIEAGKISFSADGKYISIGQEYGIHQVLGLKN